MEWVVGSHVAPPPQQGRSVTIVPISHIRGSRPSSVGEPAETLSLERSCTEVCVLKPMCPPAPGCALRALPQPGGLWVRTVAEHSVTPARVGACSFRDPGQTQAVSHADPRRRLTGKHVAVLTRGAARRGRAASPWLWRGCARQALPMASEVLAAKWPVPPLPLPWDRVAPRWSWGCSYRPTPAQLEGWRGVGQDTFQLACGECEEREGHSGSLRRRCPLRASQQLFITT